MTILEVNKVNKSWAWEGEAGGGGLEGWDVEILFSRIPRVAVLVSTLNTDFELDNEICLSVSLYASLHTDR